MLFVQITRDMHKLYGVYFQFVPKPIEKTFQSKWMESCTL